MVFCDVLISVLYPYNRERDQVCGEARPSLRRRRDQVCGGARPSLRRM